MSNLVVEILLRLAKAATALALGALIYGVAVGLVGAEPSVELALLCWLSGSAFILLIQSGPI